MKMIGKAVRVTMAMVAAALIAWGLCGCEDDGDETTVVNEASMPTNKPGIYVDGNVGTVVVNNTTSGDDDPNIVIRDNTGKVYVVNQPYISEPESLPK